MDRKPSGGTYGFLPMFESAGTGVIDPATWKVTGVMMDILQRTSLFAERLRRWSENGWVIACKYRG